MEIAAQQNALGHKQTEVGLVPQGWMCRCLGDEIEAMTDFVAAGSFESLRNNVRVYDSPAFAIYVRLFDLRLGLGHVAQKYVDEESYRFLSKSNLHGDELLIANIGANVGEVFVMPRGLGPATIAPNMIVVRTDDRKLRHDYLSFFLKSEYGKLRLAEQIAGSGHPKISKTDLKKCKILVPPVIEQRAIAEALVDVDELIDALDRVIAKKRDLKRAAMQRFLTGKIRLPGFSRKWRVRSIESFSAFVTKGATPTTYGFNWQADGVLFLRSECVSEEGLDLAQSMFISESAHGALIRGEVRSGDILLTITGNVGRAVYLKPDFGFANINQHIARIRVKDPGVLTDFVFHWLSQPSVRAYYESITTGQAYPQISLKQVRETQIPLPCLQEQTAIAEVLSDMDAEITALEQRRDKTRVLKQGMMQELLTGKTRLI